MTAEGAPTNRVPVRWSPISSEMLRTQLATAAGLLRSACSAPLPVGLQVIQALGVKHLQVGAFDHLFQPVAGRSGGDPSRDAQLEGGIVLVVELDEFREGGENGFPAGGVGGG